MPPPLATKRRPALPLRPWLRNTSWDILARDTVLHVDLFAYAGADTLFAIRYAFGGQNVVACDWVRHNGEYLAECNAPDALPPVLYWARDTNGIFAPAHRALVNRAQHNASTLLHSLGTSAPLSVHCHYVRVTDATPWPRGFVNHYREPGKAGQTRAPRKPRTLPAPLPVLPDWL